jgi:hypothetical protein
MVHKIPRQAAQAKAFRDEHHFRHGRVVIVSGCQGNFGIERERQFLTARVQFALEWVEVR